MDEQDKQRLTTNVLIRNGNTRYITITDNIPSHWDSIIEIAKTSYDFYAYIIHDSDTNETGQKIEPHLHIVAYDKGGTTLKAHCERFNSVIPANFVCKVKNPRAMCRYLIHKDEGGKKHLYDQKQVITNNMDKYASFLSDETTADSLSEFNDFVKVQNREMSVQEYIDKYRAQFYNMSFYQKVATFERLRKYM